jgi:AsmA protein
MAVDGAGCDAKLHDLTSQPNDGRKLILRLTFTGDLDCHDARAKDFTATDLKTAMAVTPGVYAFQPIVMQVYGTQATGMLHIDLASQPEHFALHYSVPQFDVARLFEAMKLKEMAEGRADLVADLSFEGHGREDIAHSVTGHLSLKSKELTLKGYDLDGELSRFESTQKFDLLDLGAVFYAGPLGLVATKGYDYAKIKGKAGGKSHIHVLVAEWQVTQGTATAEDVAMSTDRHRLALQGKVDVKDKAFDGVTVAVVDAQGCPIAAEQVTGSFKKPKLKKPGVLRTLVGPVRRLADKGKKALGRPECQVFYSGSVVPY